MKLIRNLGQSIFTVAIVVTMATSATADWHTFWHEVHVGYARKNAWPDPFTEVDANQVIRPFEIMKANGWRMHNTIGHELFRHGDGALLAAGHNKVRWIAMQSPQNRRTIHVLRGATEAETSARVTAVQDTLANIDLRGPQPQVLVTDKNPAMSSGEIATRVHRQWIENIPQPKLPSTSASGESGVAQ